MKMNIGRVRSGYYFISFMVVENGMFWLFVFYSVSVVIVVMLLMVLKICCLVSSISIIDENIKRVIIL